MGQVRLFSDLDLLVRCDAVVHLRRQPRVLRLVMECRLGAALRRELLNHLVNLLICVLEVMRVRRQILLDGVVPLMVLIMLGIREGLGIKAAFRGLVLRLRLLIHLGGRVPVHLLLRRQAPLHNLLPMVLLILDLDLGHWLDGGRSRDVLV